MGNFMKQTKALTRRILALGELTPSEIKIADFFSRNYWNLGFENTTSISNKTGVSKATVVRFISKLGYERFSVFLEELRKDVVAGQNFLPIQNYLEKKLLNDKAEEDILGRNFLHINQNLEHTYARIDQDRFWEAARLIAQTIGNVYITGQRSSYAMAYLFFNMISRIRPGCILIETESTSMTDRLLDVNADDLLVAIFRHPYAKATQRIAKHFESCDTPIIVLTDSAFNPIQKLTTVKIEVDTDGFSIFTSSASMVVVLESLNIAVLKFCDDSVYQRLEKAESLYNDFEVFCPGNSLNIERIAKFNKNT